MAHKPPKDFSPETFPEVLRQELDVLDQRRRRRFRDFRENAPEFVTTTVRIASLKEGKEDLTPQERALKSDLAGLSFSGGGIRSATFNLGVLQGLANLKLLPYFDYLSTVSGGGYIGSWLTALLHREGKRGRGILDVQRRLQTGDAARAGFAEDDAIHWLRRYSNYLTPKVGVLSADTWAVVTTYLRNLILNLTILIAALGLVLLFPQLAVWVGQQLPSGILPLALALGFALVAVLVMGFHMASFAGETEDDSERWWLTQAGVQLLIVLPLLTASYLTIFWLRQDSGPGMGRWILYTAGAYTASWFVSWCLATVLLAPKQDAETASGKVARALTGYSRSWTLLALSAPFAGAVGGALLWWVAGLVRTLDPGLALGLGPPMILAGFALTAALQTGFAGRRLHDHQREWLSRVGAWLLIYGIVWGGLFAIVLLGPVLTLWSQEWVRAGLAAGWLVTTLMGLLATRGGSGESVGGLVGRVRSLVALVAPYVFIGGLLLVLTYGLDWTLYRVGGDEMGPRQASWGYFVGSHDRLQEELIAGGKNPENAVVPGMALFETLYDSHLLLLNEPSRPLRALILFLILAVVVLAQGFRIDINEFSMHRLYRNRLVRCYLAASIPADERRRRRQPFTGFAEDDLRLHGLRRDEAGPLHLINTALNLVGGDDLAWQQRKAASFVFSPLYCGFQKSKEEGAYRPTDGYGNSPKPLTLGSALAISGAAASPNMGFRTSAALSFLLTVFNVRLGWWIGNPWREKHWRRSGPAFSTANLVAEVLGNTQDRRRFVYLSDGGHFENLGLYELVRRRCRFVLACDAGADPDLAFDDLGNAIRKCRTDLGVEITLRTDQIRKGDDGYSRWHCAVGEIDYGEQRAKGTLLYLKASLTGDEPEDLRNYAAQCAEFPHESTGDQWFDESQFESYRRLGVHIVEEVLGDEARRVHREAGNHWRRYASPAQLRRHEKDRTEGLDRPVKISFERLVGRLRERWYPRSQAAGAAFTRHGAALESLFERLRTSDDLAFLNQQFYPEWSNLTADTPPTEPLSRLPWGDERAMRHGFYFCNSLIQLMENVYLDLNLQAEHDHPDNRGWMNLFKHWSWSGMFQVTWAICAGTYGQRFQNFCQEHLGLKPLGEVRVGLVGMADRGKTLDPATFRKAAQDSHLNFHECDIIDAFLREDGNAVEEVWEIWVSVDGLLTEDGTNRAFSFGCGFALVHRRSIVLFRIQDHLRKAGLGRRGLWHLYRTADGSPGIQGEPAPGTVPVPYRGDFTDAAEQQFYALFRSVQRQVEEEENPTTDSGIEPFSPL